jgi:SAM-dependent methyltransferase
MMSTASANKAREYDALAEWYDILWPRTDDLAFYSSLAGRQSSPILELGCGTGRVACKLAEQGHRVVGIDISPRMLRKAHKLRRRLDSKSASLVDFHHMSMTDFDLPERFALIFASFSSILELSGPEDRLATYRCCIDHLADSGLFAFDSSFRGSGALSNWGTPRPQGIVMFSGLHTKAGRITHHFEAQDYKSDGRMDLTVFVDELDKKSRVRRKVFTIVRNYVSPEQTKEELREAGFSAVDVYGGFNREPLYDPSLAGSGRQIFIARN